MSDLIRDGLASALGWNDAESSRQLVAAVLTLLVFLVTAPRGRRWLARGSVVLLVLYPLPAAIALLFPSAAGADGFALQTARFLLLASLLQSLLLLIVVSGWERIGKPLPRIFLDVLRIGLTGVALITVLWEAGAGAGDLFAGSAVLTAVLGFALRDTLGNIFAGLAIHAEHPFEIDDWIQYDDNPAHVGKVVEINWRATKVITLDLAYVIIPNGQLAQASIRNFTKPDPWSRRSLFVTAPYEVPPQRVQAIMLEALRGSFGVLDEPAPSVVTNAFNERGIEYWVRLFTNEFGRRDRVDGMARDRIFYALARHGVRLPVATHQIRLTQLPPQAEVPRETVIAERTARLEAAGVLGVLTPDQLRQLASDHEERTFAAHEPIVRQGDSGGSMFIITAGRVTVTVRTAAGQVIPVRELTVGDFFGELTLLTGAPRSATVSAETETRVLEVGCEAFRKILKEQPELVDRLSSEMQRRLLEREKAIAGAEQAVTIGSRPDLLTAIREFFGMV
jgi:small-conductance mechanosensitive channel/CRP-like cAMP-binding protein